MLFLDMFDTRHHYGSCRIIATQFVGKLDEARTALTSAYEHREAGEAIRRHAVACYPQLKVTKVAVNALDS